VVSSENGFSAAQREILLQGKLRKMKEYFVYFKFFAVTHCGKRSAVAEGKRLFELTKHYNGRTRYGISAKRLRSGIASYIIQSHCTKQAPLWEDDRIRVSSSQPLHGVNLA